MKFLHTGDWHIGKKLNGYDLLEEQQYAFRQVMELADSEEVDGIIIAGDLYDRSVPSIEAVEAFNEMIVEMNVKKKYPVLAISGNHDSATRLETGGPWFEHLNFHLHTRLDQAFVPVVMGEVQVFLLPYFEPFQARKYFGIEEIRTINVAMEYVIAEMEKAFDPTMKHVLVSHFFVAGSATSDSETKVTVGGLDVVSLSQLQNFDYVALGHLHNKNALQAENARYSGSLLKYSVSEVNQTKGVWFVELTEDATTFEFAEISPLRDLEVLEASFAELMDETYYCTCNRENYLAISLTDRGVIPNVMNQLRTIYPRIIQLERAYGREREGAKQTTTNALETLNPEELIQTYFEETTGDTLTENQQTWLTEELASLSTERAADK